MKRSYRGLGRGRQSGASYNRQVGGERNYLDYGSPLRESFLDRPSGSSDYDREILHSIMQQRALEEQLSYRESQLAMANSLLLKQKQQKQQKQHHQQQPVFNKRRMDETPPPRGGGDFRMDFKRPRLVDNRSPSQPRNRSTGRDSNARGRARGARGGSRNQRNPNAPRGHGRGSADRFNGPKEPYAQERPTVDNEPMDKRKKRVWCSLCSADFQDRAALEQHKASRQHKWKVASFKVSNPPKTINNKGGVGGDKVDPHRLSNKQKEEAVTKGCAVCHMTSFRGFKDVLAHLESKKHLKNMTRLKEGKDEKAGTDLKSKPAGPRKERERIKVELPPELSKFDPKAVVGQGSVIAVTGWFCKLCNKFYNNETVAKETHCMTEPHFNNYKNFMYAKLKAKAEREAQMKRAAEEESEAAAAAVKEKDDENTTTTTTSAELSTEQMENDNQEPSEGGEAKEEEEEAGANEADVEEEAGANEADAEEETGAEGEADAEEETGVEGEADAEEETGAEGEAGVEEEAGVEGEAGVEAEGESAAGAEGGAEEDKMLEDQDEERVRQVTEETKEGE